MSGIPPAPPPPPRPPEPQTQWAPPTKSPKGSVSTKVWGVILLVFGVLGIMGLAMTIASYTGGLTSSTFTFNLDEESRRAMDEFQRDIVAASLQRWSFWAYMALELIVVALSLVAGFFLVVRPSPRGRTLAIARVLVVFVLLPITWIEQSVQMDDTAAMQDQMMTSQVEIQLEESFRQHPPEDERAAQERREEMMERVEPVRDFTKLMFAAAIVISVLLPLIFNVVLLAFMLRSGTKEYLQSAAGRQDESIPGYDPSMGMLGPPPQAGHQGAVPSPGPESTAPQPPDRMDRPRSD